MNFHKATIRLFAVLLSVAVAIPVISWQPEPVQAAASLYVTGKDVKKGDTLNVTIYVNTGGASANAFEGTLSYPQDLLEGTRGTFSGSICSLPVSTPEPSGGSATFSCGTPSGYVGTGLVATIVFTAKASGTASLGLSGCSVLANDGLGTDISGGCSGTSVAIAEPTAAPTRAATPKPSPTKTVVKAETAQTSTPEPTAEIAAPVAVTLEPTSPTPSPSAEPTDEGKKGIGQSLRNALTALIGFGGLKNNGGLIGFFLALIPFLALLLAIIFFLYRLVALERRRKRTLDRLFEMELSELAALEGKLDLLADKGPRGREQYRDEFRVVKERILREIKPDFGKPVDAVKKVVSASVVAKAVDSKEEDKK